jgi:serralysin
VGGGKDTVFASVSYKLGAKQEIEILQTDPASGKSGLSLTGNEFDNTIKGDAGENKIDGGLGDDVLYGLGGNDMLTGGAGKDVLTGGAGADHFIFRSTGDSAAALARSDVIADFEHGSDKIDLHAIDANSVSPGHQAFVLDAEGMPGTKVATGHIGWYQEDHPGTANDITVIRLNVDGNAAIEMTVELHGLIALAKGDFLL